MKIIFDELSRALNKTSNLKGEVPGKVKMLQSITISTKKNWIDSLLSKNKKKAMMSFKKLSTDDLKGLKDQIKSIQNWESKILESWAALLLKDPLRYRGFGPYWWLVKKALISNGNELFGEHIDGEQFDLLTYDTVELDLLASVYFSEITFDLGLMKSDRHNLPTNDGGSTTYVIQDEEMEALELAKTISQ